MAINIKFTKFDNTTWGFRLAGGSDFPQPLTVIRVKVPVTGRLRPEAGQVVLASTRTLSTNHVREKCPGTGTNLAPEGGLAECMGLRMGDVVVRLNDQSVSGYTHGKAHEALVLAGNNFVLGVIRDEESEKAVEAIQQENIVPYNIPLEELRPVYSPEIPKYDTPEPVIVFELSETCETCETTEKLIDPDEEALRNKPTDANSDVVANKNLTDEEIALLILEEEELLPEQGILGINFKKLRPRAPLLKDSKVFEELQKMETADPPQVQELKRCTTFLQKPERPPPLPKVAPEQPKGEPYRVVIQKQQKKSMTERLTERGLLGPIPSPEIPSQITTPVPTPTATPEPPSCTCISEEEFSRPESKMEEIIEITEELSEPIEFDVQRESVVIDDGVCDNQESEMSNDDEVPVQVVPKFDKKKMKELVTTELNLEKQLESVQSQLLALKQLPSEIETHLRIVSEQLYKIMELSGVNNSQMSSRRDSEQLSDIVMKITVQDGGTKGLENDQSCNNCGCRPEDDGDSKLEDGEECDGHEDEKRDEDQSGNEKSSSATSEAGDVPKIVQPENETVEQEFEVEVKSEDDRVKKFVISYEEQVARSRTASPAFSDAGSFKPDPNLSAKDQVIQELQQKKGRKHSKDLWPQAKQVELTYGRRWRCPNDFFNDEMIAEVLSSQAEVIHGRALGINFKKYEKTNLPNYDHLMNSTAYKMIHKMDKEPQKGIPVRPAKVNAAEDILDRAKSPASSVADDQNTESVDH